ncbi:MAG: hypothetical protein U9R08_02190 [Nanoarchaeota archaeon]|nr:hypothetical protein [Nanoarchaeota archaeon]
MSLDESTKINLCIVFAPIVTPVLGINEIYQQGKKAINEYRGFDMERIDWNHEEKPWLPYYRRTSQSSYKI